MENELSIFMARLIALVYIPIGISILNGQFKSKKMISDLQKSPALTILLALFGLTFGTILIHFHNIWVKDWPVLITILGWIVVIECVALFAFPKTLLSIGNKITSEKKIWGTLALLVGILFGYFGFLA